MKKEGTIGTASFLAIAAVVGVTLQSGPKQAESGRADHNVEAKLSTSLKRKSGAHNEKTGCTFLQRKLADFLGIDDLPPPEECFESNDADHDKLPESLSQQTSGLKFVIALMPDPAHTHSSALFDKFAVAIQVGAQDEKYDFDSSWLPWNDEESSYLILDDEKVAKREKEFQESQPGIILFRRQLACSIKEAQEGGCKGEVAKSYREGLIVFVVGEEATHGIHEDQFQNALAWIASLQPKNNTQLESVAILGPTFSGSFPSLAEVLISPRTAKHLDLEHFSKGQRLAIYSGSASSQDAAQSFQDVFNDQVEFHSFVQSDEKILGRFCKYIKQEQTGFDPSRLAIISEDETAYGGAVGASDDDDSIKDDNSDKDSDSECVKAALKLYYPRDISALRGAYQTKSLFAVGTSSQAADTQSRNLPTDLADPTGNVHDSIRSYGGNQAPLAQEAFLVEIVSALRELHARYVVLRSSNMLDQLFLANFLRRNFPDGRLVILEPDLMFIRERGSTGLSGAMTLSTYPLFPLERDWTEHQSLPAADRTFSSDNAEGTYVAFRLLLNAESLNGGTTDIHRCQVLEDPKRIFVPPVSCVEDPPIPDYSPPFWELKNQCGEYQVPKNTVPPSCPYPGPATWLSVIGVNRFWPMASLGQVPEQTDVDRNTKDRSEGRKDDPGGRPEMPPGMKLFLLGFAAFSVFHAWCCWSGSYTAKPVFRAHFASTGETHHFWLVFGGSCCVAFIAIVAGWGSGVFSIPDAGLAYPWFAFGSVAFAWLMAWGAILANLHTSWVLAKDPATDQAKVPATDQAKVPATDQAKVPATDQAKVPATDQAKVPATDQAKVPATDQLKNLLKNLNRASNIPKMTDKEFTTWNYVASIVFIATTVLFWLTFVVPVQLNLPIENRVLTYWRAMHLTSGVSPLVPIFSILIGLYLSFWFTLHGLALFGPDRPCLPTKERLALEEKRNLLPMFSQEGAAAKIELAAMPFNWNVVAFIVCLLVVFVAGAFGVAEGVPVRSLGSQNYAIIFLVWLAVCCSLSTVEAWRLYHLWDELRRLLAFLDRLPLRRTMAALRGFSWGSVWKMSGNVLEVRYKVLSRQMECMNHTIATLEEFLETSEDPGLRNSLADLLSMRDAGGRFAGWYSTNYVNSRVGDLTKFTEFQKSIADASGTLLAQALLPAWRKEKESLLVVPANDDTEETPPSLSRRPDDAHIRNAEEFVCLNYLAFAQNVLGRLRTMAMTIIALFVASACAMSSYPFDPRQALSAVLIVLFVIGGGVIVKVYADMHRDATLSHVTKTKPGELGAEFWFKLVGFGFAPLIGLLTRIFPGITDFLFSWLQPSISSLK